MLPIETYLNELKNSNLQLNLSKLSNLSALSSEEITLFKKAWSSIELDRKRQIVGQLVEIGANNYQLEFDEALRVILDDDDTKIRLKAIEGLANCEDVSFIRHFIALLDVKYDIPTRAAAAAALGQFVILAELGKLSPSHSSQIQDELKKIIRNKAEESEVRRRAIEAVAPFSQEMVKQTIRRAYDNPDPDFKRSALLAMGRNCDPVWLPFLLKELRSPDPETRSAAAIACGELCAPEAVPQLRKLTRDADIHVQISAITSLGQIGSVDAKNELLKFLNNPHEMICQAAELAIEELGFAEDPLTFDDIDD
ncbi:MAG: hypothetical protein HN929_03785 [Chloroflexi bacterium]|nr:hypothetical protein [Chloroflexota bacterium]MBT7080575.1 hypothetical protein [Chloroflexota bacterium]MBT7290835.1 hypothetical protein [Chloroflexota bacterium]